MYANIIVLQIDNAIMNKNIETSLISIAKYHAKFKKESILIFHEKQMVNEINLHTIINDDNINVEMYILNSFARNRLINNFEEERPELTLMILSCGMDSKLIKVKGENA